MAFEYNGVIHRDLEPQVRYDAEQIQLLKQADVAINENLQTINTELDGKLNKPTNPSAESAVTMLADGTVGTKLLSEIGGGGGGEKVSLTPEAVTAGNITEEQLAKLQESESNYIEITTKNELYYRSNSRTLTYSYVSIVSNKGIIKTLSIDANTKSYYIITVNVPVATDKKLYRHTTKVTLGTETTTVRFISYSNNPSAFTEISDFLGSNMIGEYEDVVQEINGAVSAGSYGSGLFVRGAVGSSANVVNIYLEVNNYTIYDTVTQVI